MTHAPATTHIAITGGSSGIGAALALRHARPGCSIALAGRNSERLAGVADLCRAQGAIVSFAIVDVTDPKAVGDWLNAIDDEHPLDIVYANAGLGGVDAVAGAAGEPLDIALNLIRTNIGGVINTAAPALARFVPRKSGQLVLIGSLAGRIGLPHAPVYSASKAAVAAYADGLRRLVGGKGVHVLLVEPGFVDTPMSQSLPDRPPLLWSADRAAVSIIKAVNARKAVLRFPASLTALIALSRILPRSWVDWVLRRNFGTSGGHG